MEGNIFHMQEQIISHLPEYPNKLLDILFGKGFDRSWTKDLLWRMLDEGQIHLDKYRRLAEGSGWKVIKE